MVDKKELKRAQQFFIEQYNNDTQKNLFEMLMKYKDNKEKITNIPSISKTIEEKLKKVEKEYEVSGLAKGLSAENSLNFIKSIIELHSEEGINFNPHKYFPHMLTGLHTIPGLTGMLEGIVMHGNNVTETVAKFANQLEIEVGKMTKEMFGYKPNTHEFDKAASFITAGGTEANELALVVGRNWSYKQTENVDFNEKGFDGVIESGKYRKPVIFIPESAHYSLEKITNIMGIGTNNIRRIKSDKFDRMSTKDLKKQLKNLDTRYQKPLAVMSVMGTTELGTVDNIEEIYNIISAYEKKSSEHIWKHLDAAYGGPAVLTDKYKQLSKIIKKYDSVTFDPHKLLWVPYNAGSITFKNALALRTISTDAPYISNNKNKEKKATEFLNELYSHLSSSKIIGSQNTGGVIATYLTLKTLGMNGIKAAIEQTFDIANYFSKKLQETKLSNGSIEVLTPEPDMNLVCFRFIPTELKQLTKDTYKKGELTESQNILNDINKDIYEHFLTDDIDYILSKTKLYKNDLLVHRTTIMHPNTTKKDIDGFVETYKTYITEKY